MLRAPRLSSLLALVLFLSTAVYGCSCEDPNYQSSGPEGRVDPTQVDFGLVEVGATKTVALTVSHTGGSRLEVTDVTIAGDRSDWYVATPHQVRVALGATSEIQVSFTPLDEEATEATLTILTNSDKMPSFVIQLAGEGFLPKVQVDPKALDFGNVIVDTTRSRQVQMVNQGTEAAAVRVLPLTGQASNQYRMTLPAGSTDGVFMLAGGQSATIEVTFAPTLTNRHLAAFTVEPCGVCQQVNVTLSGVGLESGLVVSPASIDFGAVNPGASVSRGLSFKNIGNRQVQITRVEAASLSQGTPPDPSFGVELPAEMPIVLGEGVEVVVPVVFTPTDVKSHMSAIAWASTDTKNAEGTVVVVGRGGGPDIDLTPKVMDFGPVAMGAPQRRTVLISNVGFEDLHLSGFEIRDSASFTILEEPTNLTVPVGAVRKVVVEYSPLAEQDDLGRLVVLSDDTDEMEAFTELRGTGLDLPPCVYEVAPPDLNFGMTERNKKRRLEFGVTNPVGAAGACLVSVLDLTPDTDTEFTLPDGTQSAVLIQPGETFRVAVEFQPVRLGSFDGAVHFYISDPNAPEVDVPLFGTAGQADILIAPDDLDFGVVKVGCSTRDREFCIYNTGTTAVNLKGLEIVEAGPGGEFFFKSLPPNLGSATGHVIAGGSKACFTVAYKAQDLGTDSAAIYVTLEQFPDPFLITVTGTGATDAVQTDNFVQLDKPQADILFVVDNSCSMYEEQTALGSNFGAFIRFAVNQAIDYHIAVTTTDTESSGENGRFIPLDNPANRVVHPGMADPEAIFRQNVVLGTGTSGSATEKGLMAAHRGLSEPLINDPAANGGFLRNDAHLALVFVSDEEDQSGTSYSSLTPTDFYINFFLNIRGFRRQNMFSASAIVGDPGVGCSSAAPGSRYLDVQKRTGGIFESICTQNWSRALENLSLVAFGYKTRFFLNNQPMPGTVTVVVRRPDGSSYEASAWVYDPNANAVDFDPFAIPEPGDTIEVTYEVQCL